MNFRDFVKKDNKRTIPEEPVEYFEDPVEELDEDTEEDYGEEEDETEDEYYEEPVVYVPPQPQQRVAQRPIQRVVHQQPKVQIPAPKPAPRPQPVYRPQPQRIQRSAMPVDQYNRPIQISKKQLAENTIENTANTLTEAIKRKVDTIFYRFGIQGLEKLDEKILDTIEELQYPEPKQIKKSGVSMRRVPGKRVVRKPKPLPIQDIEPALKNVPEVDESNTEEFFEELPPEPIYEDSQEPIQEPVEEPIEEPVEETVEEEPQKELSMMELAEQALNIDPSKVMKHESGGTNPVFAPQPVPVRTPTEPAEIPIALEVPEVATPKILTMPVIEESKEESASAPVEQPAPAKKTRKKKEKDTQTNEEK